MNCGQVAQTSSPPSWFSPIQPTASSVFCFSIPLLLTHFFVRRALLGQPEARDAEGPRPVVARGAGRPQLRGVREGGTRRVRRRYPGLPDRQRLFPEHVPRAAGQGDLRGLSACENASVKSLSEPSLEFWGFRLWRIRSWSCSSEFRYGTHGVIG